MTIKEFLLKCETEAKIQRIKKLEDINAPSIVIEKEYEQLDELQAGIFTTGGNTAALDMEMTDHEVKTGTGGRKYVAFNGGTIRYFPKAKFGRYIVMD